MFVSIENEEREVEKIEVLRGKNHFQRFGKQEKLERGIKFEWVPFDLKSLLPGRDFREMVQLLHFYTFNILFFVLQICFYIFLGVNISF